MAYKLTNGFLIVFEGIDGVGKTTQLELAKTSLAAQSWPVYSTRNLGGTPIGEELRKAIKTPLERPPTTDLYVSVAIQEALLTSIEAQRQQGKLILMDRCPLSLAAYQIYGSGVEEELGWKYVKKGMESLAPDLVIFYDADIGEALRRLSNTKSDYYESKPQDYFERVARGYKAAIRRFDNIVTVNANRSIEEVHEETIGTINQFLNAHSPH